MELMFIAMLIAMFLYFKSKSDNRDRELDLLLLSSYKEQLKSVRQDLDSYQLWIDEFIKDKYDGFDDPPMDMRIALLTFFGESFLESMRLWEIPERLHKPTVSSILSHIANISRDEALDLMRANSPIYSKELGENLNDLYGRGRVGYQLWHRGDLDSLGEHLESFLDDLISYKNISDEIGSFIR